MQSPTSRLEINPVTEIIVDDEENWNTENDQHNTTNNSQTNTPSTNENENIIRDIQTYERRIQGLIDGIGMLKGLVNQRKKKKHRNTSFVSE